MVFIYSIISEIVDEAISESIPVGDDSVKSVFYSILCEKDLDIRDKKSAIIDFIAAGIETLANTLIFILHYVTSSEIRALDRIKEEFENCSNEIESNSLAQAVFTKACLQETYRICPTAFCLARILQEDACLSGYNVKAGVNIVQNKYCGLLKILLENFHLQRLMTFLHHLACLHFSFIVHFLIHF